MVKIKQMLIISREEYWRRDVGLKVNPKEVKLQVPNRRYGGHALSAEILNQTLTNCDQSVRCLLLQTKEELSITLSITWTLEVH